MSTTDAIECANCGSGSFVSATIERLPQCVRCGRISAAANRTPDLDRLRTIIDEWFGPQPPLADADLIGALELLLSEETARAREVLSERDRLRASAVTPEEIAMLREAEKMLIQWAPFGGLGMATEIRALADRLEKGTGR